MNAYQLTMPAPAHPRPAFACLQCPYVALSPKWLHEHWKAEHAPQEKR